MICARCGKECSVGINEICMDCYNDINPVDSCVPGIHTFIKTDVESYDEILKLEQRIAAIEHKDNVDSEKLYRSQSNEIYRLRHGIKSIKLACRRDGDIDHYGFIRTMCHELLKK